MKTKEITPQQYQQRGFLLNKNGKIASIQYIHRLLKSNKKLPNVISVKNYGRFYTLEVEIK